MVRNRTLYVVAIHNGGNLYEIGFSKYKNRHFEDVHFTEFGESYEDMLGSASLYGQTISGTLFRVISPGWPGCRKIGRTLLQFLDGCLKSDILTKQPDVKTNDGAKKLLNQSMVRQFSHISYMEKRTSHIQRDVSRLVWDIIRPAGVFLAEHFYESLNSDF
ncbi:hypothetical protein Tco_0984035 [Tanacetum coccineum]